MMLTSRENTPLRPNLKASKDDLKSLVSKCQQRNFSEDIDFLEELGGETGDQVFTELLSVDYSRGIHASEVEERRSQYGTGRIEESAPESFFALLWRALEDLTLRILLIAAIVSIIANMIVEDDQRNIAWIEGFSILVAVFICSFVAAGNDYQKQQQFEKLKEISKAKKLVNLWRDGTLIALHESELVTGDIVKLSEGMDIPADMLLLEAHDVTTDEAALTGEPDAIKKRIFRECVAKRDEIVANGQKNNAKSHDVYSPILMSGTSILTGEGKALVLVVGEASVLGQIKKFLVQETEITPLQQKLETVATSISKFGLISAVLVLLVLLIRFLVDRGVTDTWDDGQKYTQLIRFVIIAISVLAVAIPEGLPLAVTLTLAFSVKKMMKDNNLVRRLHATETMGGADNICSDKTGTLTQNKMNLTNFWNEKLYEIDPYIKGSLGDSFPQKYHEILKQALACNGSATLQPLFGSKTEVALLEFLQNRGEDYNTIRDQYLNATSIKFPFSSQRKRMSSVLENVENGLPSKKRMHIKGASEIVLESCTHLHSFEEDRIIPMTETMKQQIEDEIENMAKKALRTICIAYKDVTGHEDFITKDNKNVYEIEKTGFVLLGVLGIRDILRKEVKGAVQRCRSAGIKVRMVTGDNKITAKAIALECGIINAQDGESLNLTGPEFIEQTGGVVCKKCRTQECDCPRDKETAKKKGKDVRVDTIANAEAFDKIYKKLDVLARSRPEDKYALVTGLIERGCVVAVTGDGTNDAPALKKADIGFAMNAGTDVAKEAADIVLLDDNFASIVKAAMWGRNIYDNIKKFLQFQLTVNIVAVAMTLISSAILQEEILTAVQLLWVNLIMDSLASLALATEPPTESLLNRKPHNRKEYIVSRVMMKHILGQALYQFAIVMMMTFSADSWVPEFLPKEEMPGYPGLLKYYQEDGVHMRSGRPYFITSEGEDYERFIDDIGPSRHYSLIFNTFVFCQVFNFINARKIHDEKNVFAGITKNWFFAFIVFAIAGIQLIIGNLGGRVFNVSRHGMAIGHWAICMSFAAFTLIWGFILKLIPVDKFCPKVGQKLTDPLHESSKIMNIKRSFNEETVQKKFSGLGSKAGSMNQIQHHSIPN